MMPDGSGTRWIGRSLTDAVANILTSLEEVAFKQTPGAINGRQEMGTTVFVTTPISDRYGTNSDYLLL
jgi:hypothetical protein